MRKLCLGAAMVAAAIAVPLSIGSSHREAPKISLDPTADNTDVYAFTAKDATGALTVVANWIPVEVPANGPNLPVRRPRPLLHPHRQHQQRQARRVVPVRVQVEGNPKSYLQAFPGVGSIKDSKLYQRQTYDIIRETHKGGKEQGEAHRAQPARRSVVCRAEDVPGLREVRRRSSQTPGGGKVFAGQRDDPFFVDLGAIFDAANIRD